MPILTLIKVVTPRCKMSMELIAPAGKIHRSCKPVDIVLRRCPGAVLRSRTRIDIGEHEIDILVVEARAPLFVKLVDTCSNVEKYYQYSMGRFTEVETKRDKGVLYILANGKEYPVDAAPPKQRQKQGKIRERVERGMAFPEEHEKEELAL